MSRAALHALALVFGTAVTLQSQVAEPLILREFPEVGGFWSVAPFSPTWTPPVLHDVVTTCEEGGACLRLLSGFAGSLTPLFDLAIEDVDVTDAARIGDLDGDGKRDWLVRTLSRKEFGSCAGSLRVVTQADPLIQALADRQPLQLREHDRVGCRGRLAALADLDGDGVAEYAAGDAECARVWSGASGEVLWNSPADCEGDPLSSVWVSAIVPLADLTGDGVGEVALGRSSWARPDAREASEPAVVEILDGRTGARVRELGGARTHAWGCAAICIVPDLDQDGVPELALALARQGLVLIVSPATGETLVEIAAPDDASNFGASLLATSDYDGDGVGELLIGAPNGGGASRDEPAHLYFVSLARREIVFTLRGRREADSLSLFANLGGHLGHWEDVDGDGRPEPCVSESQYEGLGNVMERHAMLMLSSSVIASDPRFKKLPD